MLGSWFQAKQKPWTQGRSIVDQIRLWDGNQPLRLVEPPLALAGDQLPDQLPDRYDEARLVTEFLELIRLLMIKGNEQARGALYEAAVLNSVTSIVDVILHELYRQSWWQAVKLRQHARWLLSESRHLEPLRFGIALIGLSGTEADIEQLAILARHEEFTIAAANAVAVLLPDPLDTWWGMAKQCSGWGKVHLVKRSARRCEGRSDVQNWLLRHGWRNYISAEYVAYACASAGKLDQALASEIVDEELLQSACVLIGAMLLAGPAENLEDYEGGVAAISGWLHHLSAGRIDEQSRSTIIAICAWLLAGNDPKTWERRAEQLGWTPEVRQRILLECQNLTGRPPL